MHYSSLRRLQFKQPCFYESLFWSLGWSGCVLSNECTSKQKKCAYSRSPRLLTSLTNQTSGSSCRDLEVWSGPETNECHLRHGTRVAYTCGSCFASCEEQNRIAKHDERTAAANGCGGRSLKED